MTLPRFTAGNVGRLTFRDLNDAFEIIDGVDRVQGMAGSMQSPRGRAITARVTAQSGSNYAWHETYSVNGSFVQYEQGRSSVVDGDQYAAPLISFGSLTPRVGSDVVIFPIYLSDGSLAYVPISAPSSSFAGIIMGSASIVAFRKWRYTVAEANVSGNGWSLVPDGRVVSAMNGAENPEDSVSIIGVGQGRGPASSVERQPIKTETVVQVSLDSDGNHFFCCPNGYTFTC